MRGERKVDGMSTLYIPRAQPAHMGRYICLEESSQERAHIYVYVKGDCCFCFVVTFVVLGVWVFFFFFRFDSPRKNQSRWAFQSPLRVCACGCVCGEIGACNFAPDRCIRYCSCRVRYLVWLCCVTSSMCVHILLASCHLFRLVSKSKQIPLTERAYTACFFPFGEVIFFKALLAFERFVSCFVFVRWFRVS